MKKNLGGDRLGSGGKMNVDLHNYGRSNHNLNYEWRSTMTQGTLNPFMVEVLLNGETLDVNLKTLIRTLPTIGPVFGSMKIQLDVFLCPIRLYISELHNDKLGIGMKMQNVKLPLVNLFAGRSIIDGSDINQQQINASSLLAYLGIRGLGKNTTGPINVKELALPILMYWDIYKNYYANKQEGKGFVVTQNLGEENGAYMTNGRFGPVGGPYYEFTQAEIENLTSIPTSGQYSKVIRPQYGPSATILTIGGYRLRMSNTGKITFRHNNINYTVNTKENTITPALPSGLRVTWYYTDSGDNLLMAFYIDNTDAEYPISLWGDTSGPAIDVRDTTFTEESMQIEEFDLETLDDMREELLTQPAGSTVLIDQLEAGRKLPYAAIYTPTSNDLSKMRSIGKMAGLGIKTYLSDRFNNWLETEWIDGPNGVAAVSAVDTSSGSFTMDSLNLAQKVYNMLNRIAVSGGSYRDWQEAVYAEKVTWNAETPMYMGGLSGSLGFSEVVSTADATDAAGGAQPLGSLAGRGIQTGERSGTIRVKANEPSFVMGIISFTPRIDYSQGNRWFNRLRTMDDFHKPALDGIGFQELITDEIAAWDTDVAIDGTKTYKSAGKQPSWIEYMTNTNQCYGGFAQDDSEMFMTFNRRYEVGADGNIKDLTTYIDPRKYNNAFAVQDLEAQNLWVQIGVDIHARRKMSAKMIPNL